MYQNNIFQFWKLQYDSGFIKGISDNIFIFNSSWRQEFHLTFASAAAVQCTWYQFWSEETTKYQWRFFLTLKYTGLLSPSYLTVANTDALIWSSKSAVIQQSDSIWVLVLAGLVWYGPTCVMRVRRQLKKWKWKCSPVAFSYAVYIKDQGQFFLRLT